LAANGLVLRRRKNGRRIVMFGGSPERDGLPS
jgi:hypothetical protein